MSVLTDLQEPCFAMTDDTCPTDNFVHTADAEGIAGVAAVLYTPRVVHKRLQL
jgi:hypothetical protein